MKRLLALVFVAGLLPLGLEAQEFTGSVVGAVTDSSGSVLPGTSVTIAGVTLQGDRLTITDDRGVYRVTNLPPGTYTVTYSIEGFAKLIREGIIVGVGRTVTLNVELQLATLSDAITVTGESPVVDIQNANLGVNFDQKLLDTIPIGSRNIGGVLTAIPGIQVTGFDVGGSLMGTNTGFRSYGLSGQFNVRVDGVSTQELAGNLNLYFDYGALSEMQVSAAGNSAESNVPGASVNMTVKTGGNDLHGTFYQDYEGTGFQNDNVTEALKDRGIGIGDKFDSYRDTNLNAGGPLKKDKLWWFYSYRNQYIGQTTEMKKPDGTPGALFTTRLRNNTLKVNYQLNKDNSLFFTGQTGRKTANRGGRGTNATYYTIESTGLQDSIVWLNKGQYNRILGNRATIEAAANGESYDAPYFARVDQTPVRDLVTLTVRGSYTGDSPGLTTGGVFRDASRKWQWYGAFNFFTSSHSLKTSYGVIWVDRTSVSWGNQGSPGVSPGHVVLYYSNGVPDRFQTQNTPRNYQSSMWQNYYFVQDRWQATKRLVLNLGLRWDNYDSAYPAQGNDGVGPFAQKISFPARTVAVFNNWVPRISAIYDLFGNTKTALKFNYGRYAEDPDITLVNSVNPNSVIITNRYAWDGTLPITPELVSRSRLLETVGQLTPVTIDPSLTNSYTDQWLIGVEHTLGRDFGVAGNWVRTLRYNTRDTVNLAQPTSGYAPVSAIDPGPDGLVGSSDDHPFTVFERLVPAGSNLYLTNFDNGEYYDTFEVSATKRFGNGNQIITGWDRTARHLGDSISTDPNQRLYNGSNRVTTKQWTYKLTANYSLPWTSTLSGSYSVQKGEPYSRTVQFTSALLLNHPGALAQGNTTVTVEPSSHYYRPDVHLTNVRYEKAFKRGTRKLSTLIELYNIFNSNVVIGSNSVTGRTTDRNGKSVPSFDRVTQILNPRIFRVGARIDF
jgi:Carboxypeptidase regulatory-like domain